MSENGAEPSSPPVWADRGWYLVAEFQHSPSPRFERAVSVASKQPGFRVLIDEAGTCIYRTLYRADELGSLPRLLNLIASWRDARFYVCGHLVDATRVEAWLQCYLNLERRRDPPCRERLRPGRLARRVGCYWAGITLDASLWDVWYRHYRRTDDGVFVLPTNELMARLDAWQAQFGACPFADAGYLRRVVELLPDRIDPRTDRRWKTTRDLWLNQMVLAPASRADYESVLMEYLAPLLEDPHG